MSLSEADVALATRLVQSARVPLLTCPTALTWVFLDYFDSLQDEIKYIWPGSMGLGKSLFFFIRYYTIIAVIFDVAQIHSFSTFQPSLTTCVAMDATIRVVGAISLWAVEIIMQLRIYALYNCSKRVAVFNAILFMASIGGFLWILIYNGQRRASIIKDAKQLPIPGCPVVATSIQWAQWIPATIFEGVLFIFVLLKSAHTLWTSNRGGVRKTGILYAIIVHDNLLYFFGITSLLIINNLMVVGGTIPWFSYAPFHAALGIMTTRMLLHLHKAVVKGRLVYTGQGTNSHFPDGRSAAYPMQILSTSATVSWNCGANTQLGSTTLIGSEYR